MSLIGTMSDYSQRLTALHLAARQRGQRQIISALALMLADTLAVCMASVIFRSGRSLPHLMFLPDPGHNGNPIDLFVLSALAFIVIRYAFGDYTRRRLFWDRARATTISLLLLAAPEIAITVIYPGRYSLFAVLGTWTFLLFAIPIVRQSARAALDGIGLWRLPTALIANEARVKDVFATIDNTLTLASQINWLAIEDDAPPPDVCGKNIRLLPLGDPNQLALTLYNEGCSQAVVATSDMQSENFANLVQRLMEVGIAVSVIPSFRRLPLVGTTTSYFFGKDILLMDMRSSLQGFPARFAKRSFDIIASLAGLVALLPLFIVIAILIKRHDNGPLIYGQTRTGRNGEPFKCLKFRSMAVDADERLQRWNIENPTLYAEYQKTFKLVEDPRVTKLGVWMRKTSLDELPQLVNVLRGEMSLVGPRPVLERELVEFYGAAAALYKRVRPGLTGLWQVRGRSDTSYEERVVLDEWYILNWSFWYDIVILLQTVWVVVLRKGAY